MDRNAESPLQRSSSSEDIESWTLLDRSPEADRPKMKPLGTVKAGALPEQEEESEEEENDEEESDEDESESEEADEEEEEEEEEEVQVDKSRKPSGIEPVKNKPKQTKSENVAARDENGNGRVDEQGSIKKKRSGSNTSSLSHDGCSSDGISVISESDGNEHARLLHFNKHIQYDPLQQPTSAQVTPQVLPAPEDGRSGTERSKRHKQLKRKRSHDDTADDAALVPENSVVPWRHVNRTSFMVFSILMTGVAAILVGNSRVYENRANVDNFNHEQRLSELELENTILKNEMNKLKHLYTQSELDEQVQQAEFEWIQAMDQEMQDQPPLEPEPQPEPEPPTATTEPKPEQPQVRRVPPQDENVRHQVVWSGDDGQPMLIADKDFVLPEFCYNKNAVKDELFSQYSTKYCDTKQLKIEAKLKKAEYYASKHNKHKHPRDYKQYILPTAEEVADHQKQSTASPPKVPSLSPFEFDYMRAFETIKEEGSVILQSLTAILDLDPEPELIPKQDDGYLADDEASSSRSSSSSSIGNVQPDIVPPVDAITWTDYPSWVRERYETQPEMYRKLQNKASLLWEWERKKNQFLDEVGLTTLEEVDRRTEDELRQRRQQYAEGKNGYKKPEKYEDRKGRGGKHEDRKEWKQDRPRNGDNRSYENKDYSQKDHSKEWQDKKDWPNGDKKRDYHSKEGVSSASDEASERKQYGGEIRESSGERYKDHRKHGEHNSKERKDGERKDHPQKRRENDSDERSSSDDGNNMKQYHQEEYYKKQYRSKEDYHHERKNDGRKQHHDRRRDSDHDDDDDDDDDDDHYKHRKHRNGDYRKHEQKEWHDKRHKHKDEHWNKQHHHEEKKWHDRDREHHQSKERRR